MVFFYPLTYIHMLFLCMSVSVTSVSVSQRQCLCLSLCLTVWLSLLVSCLSASLLPLPFFFLSLSLSRAVCVFLSPTYTVPERRADSENEQAKPISVGTTLTQAQLKRHPNVLVLLIKMPGVRRYLGVYQQQEPADSPRDSRCHSQVGPCAP